MPSVSTLILIGYRFLGLDRIRNIVSRIRIGYKNKFVSHFAWKTQCLSLSGRLSAVLPIVSPKAMILISFLSFISLSILSSCLPSKDGTDDKRYKGYRVLRLVPDSESQLQYLNDISNDITLSIPDKKIDFWSLPKGLNSSVDLMVSPDVYKDIRQRLSQQNIKNKVVIKDVEE